MPLLQRRPRAADHPHPRQRIISFQTSGATLALFPCQELAENVGPGWDVPRSKFTGITLAHKVREGHQVDQVLAQAAAARAQIVKPRGRGGLGGLRRLLHRPRLLPVGCGLGRLRLQRRRLPPRHLAQAGRALGPMAVRQLPT
jgi:hypothetical protein